jgi:hypothetical protein
LLPVRYQRLELAVDLVSVRRDAEEEESIDCGGSSYLPKVKAFDLRQIKDEGTSGPQYGFLRGRIGALKGE